jgi:hypothetical protein
MFFEARSSGMTACEVLDAAPVLVSMGFPEASMILLSANSALWHVSVTQAASKWMLYSLESGLLIEEFSFFN